MANFIEKFLSTNPIGKVKSAYSSTQIGSSASGLDSMLPAINDLYGVLSNRVQMSSELLPALVHSYDMFPDDVDIDPKLSQNDPSKFIVELDDTTGDVIRSSLEEVIDFGHTVTSEFTGVDGITMTDKRGHIYEIIKTDGIQVEGVNSVFSTTLNPSSKADLFLYKEDGKYKMNTLLRSKGYWRSNMSEVTPSTCYELAYSICDWLEATQLSDSILSMVRAMASFYGISYTSSSPVMSMLNDVCLHLEIQPTSADLFNSLTAIYNKVYELKHSEDFGLVSFYGDVISDLMISDTINNVVMVSCDLIRNGRFSIESFNQSISNFTHEANVSVKKVISGITSAFASGGIYGVARFILTLIKQGTSLEYLDSTGILQFTDNTNLVPTEYIAGMMTQVVGGIATVVGLIISIFSRVLGLLVSVLGSTLMTIPKAIKYDYETATWATFTPADDSDSDDKGHLVLPYFPHGLFQGSMAKDECHRVIKSMFSNGVTAFMLEIPGGIILVGPDSDENKIRYEVHLAVCDYPYIGSLYSSPWYFDTAGTDPLNPLVGYVCMNNAYAHFEINESKLLHVMETAAPLKLNVGNNGLVSNIHDDALLRLTFMRSLSLVYLWMAVNDDTDLTDRYIGTYTPIVCSFGLYDYAPYSLTSFLQKSDDLESMTFTSGRGFSILTYLSLTDTMFEEIYRQELFDEGPYAVRGNKNLYYQVFEAEEGGVIPNWNNLVAIANASNSSIGLCNYVIERNYNYPGPIKSGCYQYLSPIPSEYGVLKYCGFVNEVKDFPQRFSWCIRTPKYNRSGFMMWVFIATLVTVTLTVFTVIATVSLRRSIRTKQAVNGAKVEAAWNNFTENPTAANYKAYKKQVFKTNIFATITGGTKYSKNNYWDGDPSDSSDSDSSGVLSKALNENSGDEDAANTLISNNQIMDKAVEIKTETDTVVADTTNIKTGVDSNLDKSDDIIHLISGI